MSGDGTTGRDPAASAPPNHSNISDAVGVSYATGPADPERSSGGDGEGAVTARTGGDPGAVGPLGEKALTQMRKGVLEYCVLAHLRRGPSYGLEIAAGLGRHRRLFTSEGTLYPLLARLRRQGWVETTWRPSAAGPPRRYYGLTVRGEAAVAAFAEVWTPFRCEVDSVLAPVGPGGPHADGPPMHGSEGDER